MTIPFFHINNKTQEKILRLFTNPDSYSALPGSQYYTCAHCGTHARLHH